MLLFAHAGIPLGVAWLSRKAIVRGKLGSSWGAVSNPADCAAENRAGVGSLTTWLDYRFLFVGSILPDIIDKPLGTWLLRDALGNGRVFGHTLLFAVLLVVAGIYLCVSRRRLALLWLSFGCMAHLCLDQMWANQSTLLWPLYGWGFDKMDVSNWLETVLTSLTTEPSVYVPEIIGLLFLGAFFFNLVRLGKLYSFLRTGEAY